MQSVLKNPEKASSRISYEYEALRRVELALLLNKHKNQTIELIPEESRSRHAAFLDTLKSNPKFKEQRAKADIHEYKEQIKLIKKLENDSEAGNTPTP